jgi:hypothetical protein
LSIPLSIGLLAISVKSAFRAGKEQENRRLPSFPSKRESRSIDDNTVLAMCNTALMDSGFHLNNEKEGKPGAHAQNAQGLLRQSTCRG